MPRNKYKARSDGRYLTYVQNGFKDNGNPNRIPVYGKDSKDLEEKVAELKYKIRKGIYRPPAEITVGEYAKKWKDTYKANGEVNTRNMYTRIVDKHIVPAIGHIRLTGLNKTDIQLMINERWSKRRTCEQITLTLKQILECAIDDEIINKNICRNIVLPPKVRTEKRTLTKKEIKAIAKVDFTAKEKAFVYCLYYFGLRREEVLALMKSDFDFRKKTVTVSRAIVFDENDPKLKVTKTESGERTLDIPDIAKDVLKDYISSISTLYLFTKESGDIMSKSAYNYLFNGIRKKINKELKGTDEINAIEGLTAYTFRRTFATNLYYSNYTLKKAAQLMGHTDTKMITEVYAQLDEEKEKSKVKINKMFTQKNAI